MKYVIAGALVALSMFASTESRADFRRVCRGASLYKYDNEIKKAVRAKLNEASIPFRRIGVTYSGITRPHDPFVNDFAADLTVGSGEHPSVSFTGAFPDVTTCTIPLNVRITVVYPDGSKSITVNPTTVQGTLLPPLGPQRSDRDE